MVLEHGNKDLKRPSQKLSNAKVWMAQYFKLVGDKMHTNGQIHLPSWDSRKGIYVRYKEDMKIQMEGEAKNQIISLSRFYKLWKC